MHNTQEVECADDDIHLAEQVDWLAVEAGVYSTQADGAAGHQIHAATFLTNGSAAAPHYEPATYVVPISHADTEPRVLHVNCGDVSCQALLSFCCASTVFLRQCLSLPSVCP
eukprot:SAG22_NODE_18_length_32591_cov_38.043549_27_plen_112_part_00